ncbi:DUF1194 domain-containing protein [Yoonia sp. GPGPB17]|uniref:DUF1194 domain-containing protein n=1 Tax=Yoonia sp. GPGPB17 TaxID=3026147 RepID=UPI0030C3423F
MRAILCASLMNFATPAPACEVALMLAVDVSGSVDPDEYRIQMDGLAAGLLDSSVSAALVGGQSKLALMQWTGTSRQEVVIGWSTMHDDTDVLAFANQVVVTPRIWRNFSTAIGEALVLSLPYFAQVPECERYVVDISGDGPSNEGRVPNAVWPELRAAGVTVNALVIEASVPGLTRYFESDVITGPAAFAVTANTFEDYPAEIRRKLLRELTKPLAALDP